MVPRKLLERVKNLVREKLTKVQCGVIVREGAVYSKDTLARVQ